jgi:hypothetical protein
MKALPYEGFFAEPDPVPETVTVCPYCWEEAVHRGYGDETLTCCDGCERVIEHETVQVPVEVYEEGAEACEAYTERIARA